MNDPIFIDDGHCKSHFTTYGFSKGIHQNRGGNLGLIPHVIALGNNTHGWTHITRIGISTVLVNELRVRRGKRLEYQDLQRNTYSKPIILLLPLDLTNLIVFHGMRNEVEIEAISRVVGLVALFVREI